MHQLGRTVRVFAVLVSLLAPVMACAVPSAQMSPSEQACCKHMRGRCGSMPMQHSCCKSTPDKSDLPGTLAIAPLKVSHAAAVVVLALPMDANAVLPPSSALGVDSSESPPSSSAISRQTLVLRI